MYPRHLASNFQFIYVQGARDIYIARMPCRAARQNVRRCRLVSEVVNELHVRLRTPNQQKRIAMTNRLLPLGSLRKAKIQKILGGWPNEYAGRRCFTKAFVRQVNALLRARYGLDPCSAEEDRIKRLLQNVRKRKVGKPVPAMVSMDDLETMPFNIDEEWGRKFALKDRISEPFVLIVFRVHIKPPYGVHHRSQRSRLPQWRNSSPLAGSDVVLIA